MIGNHNDLNKAKKLSLEAEVAVEVDCHKSPEECSRSYLEEQYPGIDGLNFLMNRVGNSSTEGPIST